MNKKPAIIDVGGGTYIRIDTIRRVFLDGLSGKKTLIEMDGGCFAETKLKPEAVMQLVEEAS